MIKKEISHEATSLMAAAILEILLDATERCSSLPQNQTQRMLRFSSLARVGEDVYKIASAANILLRRSGLEWSST